MTTPLAVIYQAETDRSGLLTPVTWPLCNAHHLRPCHHGCTLVRHPHFPITTYERGYLLTLGLHVAGERREPL